MGANRITKRGNTPTVVKAVPEALAAWLLFSDTQKQRVWNTMNTKFMLHGSTNKVVRTSD